MQFLSKKKCLTDRRDCVCFFAMGIHLVGRQNVSKYLSDVVESCDLFPFSKEIKGFIVVNSY